MFMPPWIKFGEQERDVPAGYLSGERNLENTRLPKKQSKQLLKK
jgi:hypothetical protein